jgi:hypothetical protein
MVLSHFDFGETRDFLDRLSPPKDSLEVTADPVLRRALMTPMLVSYCRPFARSDADGETARQLPDELLEGLEPELLQLHHRVRQLRNEEFAHTDPSPAALRVTWREEGFVFPMPISNVTRQGLTEDELRKMRTLLTQVSTRLFDRYVALGTDLYK